MENGFDVVNLHGSVSGVVPVPVIGQNGNWYVGNQDTGTSAQGEKGDTGETGPQGPKGEQGIPGETGSKGDKGDTPELAANLTTIVEGKALDATMGKILDDKIQEVNSNLGSLSFKEDADGSKWVRGADSVWVRLGKPEKYRNIEPSNQYKNGYEYINEFNIQALTSKYGTLSADDIIIEPILFETSGSLNVSIPMYKVYLKSTGVLKLHYTTTQTSANYWAKVNKATIYIS